VSLAAIVGVVIVVAAIATVAVVKIVVLAPKIVVPATTQQLPA
jgi:hypothetical protein